MIYIYIHIYDEMVDTKVAIIFAELQWQDSDGNPYKESDLLGC